MKLKLFWYANRNIGNAELGINAWLQQQAQKIEVIQIKQSLTHSFLTQSNLVISIWYREV